MCEAVRDSSEENQTALIRAHPDLVGRAVLTAESQGEQTAAGLMDLSAREADPLRAVQRRVQGAVRISVRDLCALE